MACTWKGARRPGARAPRAAASADAPRAAASARPLRRADVDAEEARQKARNTVKPLRGMKHAVMSGDVVWAKSLIQLGMHVDMHIDKKGNTALMLAAISGHAECAAFPALAPPPSPEPSA